MAFRKIIHLHKQDTCILPEVKIILIVVSFIIFPHSEEGFGWSNIFALVDQEIAISTEISQVQNLTFRIVPHSAKARVSFFIHFHNENNSAQLCFYTLQGKCTEIITLKGSRAYSVHWDVTDRYGKSAAPGIYYARLITGSNTIAKKFLFLR